MPIISPPLQLDDRQMDALLAAAHPLPPDRRSAFLAACAQELAKLPAIGDGSVHRIVMAVQRQFWRPIENRGRPPHVDDDLDDRPRRRRAG